MCLKNKNNKDKTLSLVFKMFQIGRASGEPSNGDCTRMGFHLANHDHTWETNNCLSDSAFYFVCEEPFNKTAKGIIIIYC
jgi:hypothetical protein